MKTPQQFLNEVLNNNSSIFNEEFCMAILSANISFDKLENELFCNFLEKYIGKKCQLSLLLEKIM